MKKYLYLFYGILKYCEPAMWSRMFCLMFLFICNAILELFGITLIFPFFSVLNNFVTIQDSTKYKILASYLPFLTPKILVLIFACLLGFIFMSKNLFTIWLNAWQFKLVKKWQLALSTKLFNSFLRAPYLRSLSRSSSEQISLISNITDHAINQYILQSIMLCSNIVLLGMFLIYLFSSYFVSTLLSGSVLLGLLYCQNRYIKRNMLRLGSDYTQLATQNYKMLQCGIFAIKETKMTLKESFFLKSFVNSSARLHDNERQKLIFRFLPTSTTEMILISGVIIMACSVIFFSYVPGIRTIGDMALLAVCAFRMSPLINRSISSIGEIHGSFAIAEKLMTELNMLESCETPEITDQAERVELSEIVLKNVNFRYPDADHLALNQINLTIDRNCFLGIFGQSGSGKTTLIDTLLGLLPLERGQIMLDGKQSDLQDLRNLRNSVGYVSQNPIILECSIKENIAFGEELDKIDSQQIWESIQVADLNEFVSNLPNGIDSVISENGKNLSGGQRQRIAIARAIYRKPKLLILDEATSALDLETEHNIMECLRHVKGKLTIIAIAHRLSTLRQCDRLVYMESGQIIHQGTWSDLKTKSGKIEKLFALANI